MGTVKQRSLHCSALLCFALLCISVIFSEGTSTGERGASMFRTKSDLSLGGDVIGGSIQNGKGAKVDIDADYPTVGRSKRSGSKCQKCRQKCLKNHRPEC